MQTLSLGFSPCPNDTYIFDALVHRKIDVPFAFDLWIKDVEDLNVRAKTRSLDVTKISIHAWFHLLDKYNLLPSGGAAGRGCGPLLISRDGKELTQGVIALPGELTTANLLFQLAYPGNFTLVFMPFETIMPAIKDGKVDAGVIIHESRFTYEAQGLNKVLDLGQWWEKKTSLPIPLGGILTAKDLSQKTQETLGHKIKESIQFAQENANAPLDFIKEHSQELATDVVENHIGLYVNDYSLDFGAEGKEAIEVLYHSCVKAGIVKDQGSLVPHMVG